LRIAILEDDAAQMDLLQHTVKALGYAPHCFSNGQALMRALSRDTFDMFILDWELPDTTGIQVVRWVRAQQGALMPILMVTQRSGESDIIEGLNAGADDYMVKPVRVAELLARITALLRRSYPQAQDGVAVFGRYTFHMVQQGVEFDGRRIELKQKEFLLAYLLFVNLGRLLSRSYLQQAVWGLDADVGSRTLDTHLSRVRSLLNLRPENGFRLVAAYSHGYRLESLSSAPTASSELAATR